MLRSTPILCALALLVAAPTALAATSGTGGGNPATNRTLSQATRSACGQAPQGATCQADALADINAARAAEGVSPMTLPSTFAAMTIPQQLLTLANAERVDRGLSAISGLTAALNADAQRGAANDTDPQPGAFDGTAWSADWEGGYGSTLEADFAWMYDDGPGSANLDCTAGNTSGCWGHRHDILYPFQGTIVMGAAEAPGQYGPSIAELFMGGVNHPTVLPSAAGGSTAGTTVGSAHARPRFHRGRGVRSRAHHAVRGRHRRGG